MQWQQQAGSAVLQRYPLRGCSTRGSASHTAARGGCHQLIQRPLLLACGAAKVSHNAAASHRFASSWWCDDVYERNVKQYTSGATPCTSVLLRLVMPQTCPLWLVNCGGSCNMPGVPCSEKAQVLCPVVPLEGWSCKHWRTLHCVQAAQVASTVHPAGHHVHLEPLLVRCLTAWLLVGVHAQHICLVNRC